MWEQIRANQRNSAILVIIMALLMLGLGYAIGELTEPGLGSAGLGIALLVWFCLTLISFFSGDSIFLSISKARRLKPEDHPVLFNVVEEMKIAAGLPRMPDVYLIDDGAPNAFATGRNPEKASVAVTAGLLEQLDRNELQGVIAHELGHIRNRDILYMTMVGVMLGTIVLLADWGRHFIGWGGSSSRRRTSSDSGGGQIQMIILAVSLIFLILAPLLAHLIYYAVSRKREYLADASAIQFTRYPEGLASALDKISKSPLILQSANRAMAPLYIANPLKATASGLADLTSTHPPISERIRILKGMAGGAGFDTYNEAFKRVTGRKVGVIPASALKSAAEVAVAEPPATPASSHLERTRETTDLLWKLNNYSIIHCACGNILKIPPAYAGRTIPCPRCKTAHGAAKQGQIS